MRLSLLAKVSIKPNVKKTSLKVPCGEIEAFALSEGLNNAYIKKISIKPRGGYVPLVRPSLRARASLRSSREIEAFALSEGLNKAYIKKVSIMHK